MPDPVVRKALHAVHAFLLELDGNVFTLFADEGLCTDRKRAPDGLGVVALVGGRELHDVTGCDLHEGWPNTTAIGPLLSSLISTSAAQTVPAHRQAHRESQNRQFLNVSTLLGWISPELADVRECRYPLPPAGNLSQRNVAAGSLDISGVNIVARRRGG